MAGEYNLNLSDGSVHAILYPLEVNGPNSISTPRLIQGTISGGLGLGSFDLADDLTYRFVAGFQFDVQSSAGGLNDGTYTVSAGGATFAAGITTIPVDEAVPSDAVPLGQIQYAVPVVSTTLNLNGRGTINYGEHLIENDVHILENFADTTAPVSPLIGQEWYDTNTGIDSFFHWDGTSWVSNFSVGINALSFKDTEDSDKLVYISASETNLPGFVGPAVAKPGLVVWNSADPAVNGDPIFRVLDFDGNERLNVEHDGYTRTSNNLEVQGTGDTFVYGSLGIGNTNTPLTYTFELTGDSFFDGASFFNALMETHGGYYASVFAAATTPQAADAYVPNIEYVEAPMRAEKEPTGVTDRADSVLSFANGTNTFSITPTGASFDYWIQGAKYVISAQTDLVMSTAEGMHYIYFDDTKTLQDISVFDADILLSDNAYVCAIYWDATNSQAIYIADERHGLTMDGATHAHLHLTMGCQFVGGLALSSMNVQDAVPNDASSQFDVENGIIRDEDIQHNITDGSPQTLTGDAEIPVYYRDGASANWRVKAADTFPYIYSGSAGYTGGSGLAAYNLDTAGTWSLAEVTNNDYFLMHYLATNDIDNPIVGICGTNNYTTANNAYDGANNELATLTGLPFEEFTPIASVLFQCSTGYTGSTHLIRVHQVQVSTSPPVYADYMDWRDINTFTSVIGGGGITDHGNLSGLADDDHLQYVHIDGTHLMTGQLQGIDGSAAAPAFTFTSETDLGMYWVAADTLGFATQGTQRLEIESDGTLNVSGTANYEALVTDDDDIPNKKYIDDTVAAKSWRDPVKVVDATTYANIAAAEAAANVADTVDGETIIVGDRLLFTDLTAGSLNVYVVSGSTGAWTFTADPTNTLTVGDTVYVQEGTDFGKVFAYNKDLAWELISGSGGGGGTFFTLETFTAGVGQTVFTLTKPYKPTLGAGSRLLVFVDGVKYIVGLGYFEDSPTQVTMLPPIPFVGTEKVEFYALVEATLEANISQGTLTGAPLLAGAPTISLPGGMTYVANDSSLLVYLNGQKMIGGGVDYTEVPGVPSNTITWSGTTLVSTDVMEFYSAVPITAGTTLGDVDDIDLSGGIVNGQGLLYNSTSQLWEPANVANSQGTPFDLVFATLAQTVVNTTNVTTVDGVTNGVTGSSVAYQQVYKNGILQREDDSVFTAGGNYYVSGANQITFAVGLALNDEITVYEL